MGEVIYVDHPLVQHKISILRNKDTGTNEFRALVQEIAMLEAYEALRDLSTEDVEVETPLMKCKTPMLSGRKIALVPILRAGLGMTEGVLKLDPSSKVGHIGVYRDPKTHLPQEYFCKLPPSIDERIVLVLDPMLATGGSASEAITFIKQHGGINIKFMCIVAAPEGIDKLRNDHPDVQIYVGHIDEGLNDNAYIIPGLGDVGDRIFGTI